MQHDNEYHSKRGSSRLPQDDLCLPDSYDPVTKTGKWTYEKKIGEGGFGVVWQAWRVHGNGFVAIKILKNGKARDCILATREVRYAKRLEEGVYHPKTGHRMFVRYLEDHTGLEHFSDEALNEWAQDRKFNNIDINDVIPKDPYLVMELIKGKTVKSLLMDNQLTIQDSSEILSQAAAALAHLRKVSCIHRDFRVHNLMWHDGQLRVIDFGLGLYEVNAQLASMGNPVVRTFWKQDSYWMPPEVKRLHHESPCNFYPYEPSSFDIFSYGVLVIELMADPKLTTRMTKAKKYIEDQNTARLEGYKARHWSNLSQESLDPVGLDIDLLFRCLSASPKERPTADEILKVMSRRDNDPHSMILTTRKNRGRLHEDHERARKKAKLEALREAQRKPLGPGSAEDPIILDRRNRSNMDDRKSGPLTEQQLLIQSVEKQLEVIAGHNRSANDKDLSKKIDRIARHMVDQSKLIETMVSRFMSFFRTDGISPMRLICIIDCAVRKTSNKHGQALFRSSIAPHIKEVVTISKRAYCSPQPSKQQDKMFNIFRFWGEELIFSKNDLNIPFKKSPGPDASDRYDTKTQSSQARSVAQVLASPRSGGESHRQKSGYIPLSERKIQNNVFSSKISEEPESSVPSSHRKRRRSADITSLSSDKSHLADIIKQKRSGFDGGPRFFAKSSLPEHVASRLYTSGMPPKVPHALKTEAPPVKDPSQFQWDDFSDSEIPLSIGSEVTVPKVKDEPNKEKNEWDQWNEATWTWAGKGEKGWDQTEGKGEKGWYSDTWQEGKGDKGWEDGKGQDWSEWKGQGKDWGSWKGKDWGSWKGYGKGDTWKGYKDSWNGWSGKGEDSALWKGKDWGSWKGYGKGDKWKGYKDSWKGWNSKGDGKWNDWYGKDETSNWKGKGKGEDWTEWKGKGDWSKGKGKETKKSKGEGKGDEWMQWISWNTWSEGKGKGKDDWGSRKEPKSKKEPIVTEWKLPLTVRLEKKEEESNQADPNASTASTMPITAIKKEENNKKDDNKKIEWKPAPKMRSQKTEDGVWRPAAVRKENPISESVTESTKDNNDSPLTLQKSDPVLIVSDLEISAAPSIEPVINDSGDFDPYEGIEDTPPILSTDSQEDYNQWTMGALIAPEPMDKDPVSDIANGTRNHEDWPCVEDSDYNVWITRDPQESKTGKSVPKAGFTLNNSIAKASSSNHPGTQKKEWKPAPKVRCKSNNGIIWKPAPMKKKSLDDDVDAFKVASTVATSKATMGKKLTLQGLTRITTVIEEKTGSAEAASTFIHHFATRVRLPLFSRQKNKLPKVMMENNEDDDDELNVELDVAAHDNKDPEEIVTDNQDITGGACDTMEVETGDNGEPKEIVITDNQDVTDGRCETMEELEPGTETINLEYVYPDVSIEEFSQPSEVINAECFDPLLTNNQELNQPSEVINAECSNTLLTNNQPYDSYPDGEVLDDTTSVPLTETEVIPETDYLSSEGNEYGRVKMENTKSVENDNTENIPITDDIYMLDTRNVPEVIHSIVKMEEDDDVQMYDNSHTGSDMVIDEPIPSEECVTVKVEDDSYPMVTT